MHKLFLSIASVTGALAVVIGAFGAHALKAKLSPEQLQVFETGVKYQFYHTFAILTVGVLLNIYQNSSSLTYSGWAFLAGIILFSGSLYLLSCKGLLGIESWKWLGPVTPLGGLCFITGWALMLISILKK